MTAPPARRKPGRGRGGTASVMGMVALGAVLALASWADGRLSGRPVPAAGAPEPATAGPPSADLVAVVLPPPPEPVSPAPVERPAAEPVSPPPPARHAPLPEPPSEPPAPDPEPAAAPPAPVTPEAVGEGRALLRLLEHGAGPAIEIAWPDAPSERDRLHDLFTRCYGMRVMLLDGRDRLFRPGDPPGRPWTLDADRFSGFVRAPAGIPAAAEQSTADRLRRLHGVAGATPVRVFPRRVDAMLLGGLRQAIGDGYAGVATARAAYRVSGQDVIVDRIRADGRMVAGAIRLPRGTCAAR